MNYKKSSTGIVTFSIFITIVVLYFNSPLNQDKVIEEGNKEVVEIFQQKGQGNQAKKTQTIINNKKPRTKLQSGEQLQDQVSELEPLASIISSLNHQGLNPDQVLEELSYTGIKGFFKRKGHPKTGERLEMSAYPSGSSIQEFHAVYDLINEKPIFSSLRFSYFDTNNDPEQCVSLINSDLDSVKSNGSRKVWHLSSGLTLIVKTSKGDQPANKIKVYLEYPHVH